MLRCSQRTVTALWLFGIHSFILRWIPRGKGEALEVKFKKHLFSSLKLAPCLPQGPILRYKPFIHAASVQKRALSCWVLYWPTTVAVLMLGQSKWLTPSFCTWMKPSLSAGLWVVVMALGAYDGQVSLKMCNASLLDSDSIFFNRPKWWLEAFICPSQKKKIICISDKGEHE